VSVGAVMVGDDVERKRGRRRCGFVYGGETRAKSSEMTRMVALVHAYPTTAYGQFHGLETVHWYGIEPRAMLLCQNSHGSVRSSSETTAVLSATT